jgi:hypothetical protein
MVVDKAGGDDASLGVDRARRRSGQFADLDDLAVLDRDVAAIGGTARAVDDAAVLDQQVVSHRGLPQLTRP